MFNEPYEMEIVIKVFIYSCWKLPEYYELARTDPKYREIYTDCLQNVRMTRRHIHFEVLTDQELEALYRRYELGQSIPKVGKYLGINSETHARRILNRILQKLIDAD